MIFSLDGASPAMPTGYVRKRALGWARTEGSGNLYRFRMIDDLFLWAEPKIEATLLSAPATATPLVITAPPNVVALLSVIMSHASAQRYALFAHTDDPDVAPSASLFNVRTGSGGTGLPWNVELLTNSSSQIRHRADLSGGAYGHIITRGWIGPRGRDQ